MRTDQEIETITDKVCTEVNKIIRSTLEAFVEHYKLEEEDIVKVSMGVGRFLIDSTMRSFLHYGLEQKIIVKMMREYVEDLPNMLKAESDAQP